MPCGVALAKACINKHLPASYAARSFLSLFPTTQTRLPVLSNSTISLVFDLTSQILTARPLMSNRLNRSETSIDQESRIYRQNGIRRLFFSPERAPDWSLAFAKSVQARQAKQQRSTSLAASSTQAPKPPSTPAISTTTHFQLSAQSDLPSPFYSSFFSLPDLNLSSASASALRDD